MDAVGLFFCAIFSLVADFYYTTDNLVYFILGKQHESVELMKNLAILSHRSEPFKDFCRESGLINDLPDDLSRFRIIGNAFGGGEIVRLGDNEWDQDLEFEIINGTHVQNIKLSSISNLMSENISR